MTLEPRPGEPVPPMLDKAVGPAHAAPIGMERPLRISPVYTPQVLSVHPEGVTGRAYQGHCTGPHGYTAWNNRAVAVVPLIENPDAADNIDEICAHDAVRIAVGASAQAFEQEIGEDAVAAAPALVFITQLIWARGEQTKNALPGLADFIEKTIDQNLIFDAA